MRVPVIIHKPGACFPIVDNHIRVYAYETDHNGTVTKATIIRINMDSPLIHLREKYAAKQNIFPHEIDMFYEDREVFDDDTCSGIGIQHEQIVRMQVTFDTIYSKLGDGADDGY